MELRLIIIFMIFNITAFLMPCFESGARNETETQLLGALHADLLSDYYKTLSCLQEQLIVKAIKVASRLYLKPGEYQKSN